MSGTEFLLDTNVVIGLLNRSQAAFDIGQTFGIDLAGNSVSQITRMELLGFRHLTLDDEKTVRAFLAHCDVLPIDDPVEAETIAMRRRIKLSLPDAIVAATAVVHGLTLITLDQQLMQAYQGWLRV
jgi:predicted nucleic acid-binding protein